MIILFGSVLIAHMMFAHLLRASVTHLETKSIKIGLGDIYVPVWRHESPANSCPYLEGSACNH